MSSSVIDISVIVLIYNVEKYIEKCLRSLFTQTKTDGVEYVLINDATPDRSMQIVNNLIDEFNIQNVKIINNNINLGCGGARKKGIEAASGDYTIFVDSDDWCEPSMLEELYSRAKDSNADIVGCDYYIDRGDSLNLIRMPLGKDSVECVKKVLDSSLTQSLWSKMVRREIYNQPQVTFFIEGVDTWEDLITSVKLFYFAKKVEYIPKAFYHYMQVNTGSITHSGYSQKRLNDVHHAVNDIEVFFSDRNFNNLVYEGLISRKLRAKFIFTIKSSPKIGRLYQNIYPETNAFIHNKSISKYRQVLLYLVSKKFVYLAHTIYVIRIKLFKN